MTLLSLQFLGSSYIKAKLKLMFVSIFWSISSCTQVPNDIIEIRQSLYTMAAVAWPEIFFLKKRIKKRHMAAVRFLSGFVINDRRVRITWLSCMRSIGFTTQILERVLWETRDIINQYWMWIRCCVHKWNRKQYELWSFQCPIPFWRGARGHESDISTLFIFNCSDGCELALHDRLLLPPHLIHCSLSIYIYNAITLYHSYIWLIFCCSDRAKIPWN